MTSDKKSFILHKDSLGILKKLTDEQAGKLFKAIRDYQLNGEIYCDQQTELILFPFQSQFDRDNESYLKMVERNKNNGSKGGRPSKQTITKKPNGLNGLNNKPKKGGSEKDSGSDNGSDKEIIKLSFDHWWDEYPTERRKNKKGCLVKWKLKCKGLNHDQINNLTNKLSVDIRAKIEKAEDVKYIPMTEPYLNQERWRDGE